jgi:hypothetical protein
MVTSNEQKPSKQSAKPTVLHVCCKQRAEDPIAWCNNPNPQGDGCVHRAEAAKAQHPLMQHSQTHSQNTESSRCHATLDDATRRRPKRFCSETENPKTTM